MKNNNLSEQRSEFELKKKETYKRHFLKRITHKYRYSNAKLLS